MNGDCGSNAKMSNVLKDGMVFAISSWSTQDNWLWKKRCQAQSCNSADLNFNNFWITTGDKTYSGPLKFGNACATKWDGECNGSCDCRWSWPTTDPAAWDSRKADCRCQW